MIYTNRTSCNSLQDINRASSSWFIKISTVVVKVCGRTVVFAITSQHEHFYDLPRQHHEHHHQHQHERFRALSVGIGTLWRLAPAAYVSDVRCGHLRIESCSDFVGPVRLHFCASARLCSRKHGCTFASISWGWSMSSSASPRRVGSQKNIYSSSATVLSSRVPPRRAEPEQPKTKEKGSARVALPVAAAFRRLLSHCRCFRSWGLGSCRPMASTCFPVDVGPQEAVRVF